MMAPKTKKPIEETMVAYVDRACEKFGVSEKDFYGKSRKGELPRARQCVGFMLKKVANPSYSNREIATAFKVKHPSIISGLATFKKQLLQSNAGDKVLVGKAAYVKEGGDDK